MMMFMQMRTGGCRPAANHIATQLTGQSQSANGTLSKQVQPHPIPLAPCAIPSVLIACLPQDLFVKIPASKT
jgi:hypothetical protein